MALDALELLSEHACFGGVQRFYKHHSVEIGLPMRFGLFLPSQALTGATVPLVTYLAGLTCTEETFTINVTNVNEAPTGADATITINEDTLHTLTSANFGFSDVDAGDSLSAMRIDTLPSAGSLTLSGVAVTAGQVITLADITAGNLVFSPGRGSQRDRLREFHVLGA